MQKNPSKAKRLAHLIYIIRKWGVVEREFFADKKERFKKFKPTVQSLKSFKNLQNLNFRALDYHTARYARKFPRRRMNAKKRG